MSAPAESIWLLLGAAAFGLPTPDPVVQRSALLRRHLGRHATVGGRIARPAVDRRAVAVDRRATAVANLAGLLARPGGRVVLAATCAGALTAAGVRPLAAAAVGLVVMAMLSGIDRAYQAGRVRRRRAQLRAALTLLAAELDAGAPEADALRAAAAVCVHLASALAGAARTAERGGDVSHALLEGGDSLASLAAAWRVRAACGAALAALVGQVERDLAAADTRSRDVDAALAGPRASALVVAGLPVVGIGLGTAMGAHPLPFLLTTGPGSALLCAGAMFDGAGLLWIARMTRVGNHA